MYWRYWNRIRYSLTHGKQHSNYSTNDNGLECERASCSESCLFGLPKNLPLSDQLRKNEVKNRLVFRPNQSVHILSIQLIFGTHYWSDFCIKIHKNVCNSATTYSCDNNEFASVTALRKSNPPQIIIPMILGWRTSERVVFHEFVCLSMWLFLAKQNR